MLTERRLQELLSAFPCARIGVVGDLFLDKYLDFDPELAQVSLESGRTAHQVIGIRHSPGAAGTVVSNLLALGAGEVILVGFTGDDGEGFELRQDLQALGCSTEYLLCVAERSTPTYLKPQHGRVPGVAGEADRYDIVNRAPLPARVETHVLASLLGLLPALDALIVADQVEDEECGVITTRLRLALAGLAEEFPHVLFWGDSRRRIGLFEHVVAKPNQAKAIRAVCPDWDEQGSAWAPTDDLVLAASRALRARTGRPVFLTRAERGILVFEGEEPTEVPAVRVEGLTDPTGAGDSATAGAVLTLTAGGTPVEAALVANLVASLTIQELGITGTADPSQLPPRLALWKLQQGLAPEGRT